MSGLWEAERAVLTREVDRLTRELADCEAHLTGARRDFEAASRVMLEASRSECEGLRAWGREIDDHLVKVKGELAERTRERDDARKAAVYARAHAACPGGKGLEAMARIIASKQDWGYLYPEEPQP